MAIRFSKTATFIIDPMLLVKQNQNPKSVWLRRPGRMEQFTDLEITKTVGVLPPLTRADLVEIYADIFRRSPGYMKRTKTDYAKRNASHYFTGLVKDGCMVQVSA
jgi:hypothetical protein